MRIRIQPCYLNPVPRRYEKFDPARHENALGAPKGFVAKDDTNILFPSFLFLFRCMYAMLPSFLQCAKLLQKEKGGGAELCSTSLFSSIELSG